MQNFVNLKVGSVSPPLPPHLFIHLAGVIACAPHWGPPHPSDPLLRPASPHSQEFVSGQLGAKFTEPPPFDLAGSYKESSSTSPLLFVLSPGSDPTAALLKFAEVMGYGAKISVISMGQGQVGGWSCVVACHV